MVIMRSIELGVAFIQQNRIVYRLETIKRVIQQFVKLKNIILKSMVAITAHVLAILNNAVQSSYFW